MATLQAADIDDLVKTTQRELSKGRYTQIAQRLQDYEITKRLFKRDKVVYDSGYEVQFDVMVDHSDAAKMVGLFGVDDVDVPSVMQQVRVPFRHTTTNWAYDLREQAMNSGSAKIVDTVKMRHAASMISLAEKIEDQGWGEPSSSTDDLSVFGLKYWIVANSSAGFNGGNNSNFSAGPGGLNSSTFTRWKNYTAQYAAITKTDLVRKMKTAFRSIRFMTPDGVQDFRRGKGERYRIYMNEPTIVEFEELAEAQNDKLGRDLASMDGVTTFKGIAVKWAAKLDGTTSPTNPVYMWDSGSFFPTGLKGNFMTINGPKQSPNQHMVRETHLDLSWNMCCKDRRRQAVLVTAT